jgi:outer membrane receptor protein involved in Fe transport
MARRIVGWEEAGRAMFRFALSLALCILASTGPIRGDTKGKLTGKISDTKSQGVLGANVMLIGTAIGAAADPDGEYIILNVPPGVYDVRVSAVGYQTKVVKEVRLNSGQTTTLNVTISEMILETGEVTTVAERPLVDTRQTSSIAILNKDDISVLPVQNLTDMVNLQAGVVDGHFRGGRAGEVQYQVDGVSVNNPYDNTSVIQLDKSVLEEVQVITGSFDAEYGQAMSGVVNAVLRSGSDERYEVSAEAYGGAYVIGPSDKSLYPDVKVSFPPVLQSYTVSVSGPTQIVPQTSFLVNMRRFVDDGYLFGTRFFVPMDASNFANKIFSPTGDNGVVSMARQEEWSGQFKVSNRSLKDIQISLQTIVSIGNGRSYDFAYRFNPDGLRTQRRWSIVWGGEFTASLSPTTFFTVSLRQNYFHYTDFVFDNVSDGRYFAAGVPRGDPNYELGALIQGYDFGRFEQKSNSGLLKFSLTSQVTPIHLVKFGLEAQTSAMGFGNPGTLGGIIINGTQSNVYIVPDTLSQDVRTYYPTSIAVFVQDRIEFTDFLIRAGVRAEYYDPNSSVPSDLENPANAIPPPVPQSVPKRTTKKIVVAPRLGVSYPVTAAGALYFSYGHFYQMPGLGNLYANSDYSILRNLQSGAVRYGVMGNPDIKPEFTTQYEFGFKQQFGQLLGLDLSVFYKDIRDLLGVEFIDTYAASEYARFTNVDFGSVNGVKLSVDGRVTNALSFSLNYTYENAFGNSSDPHETANRAAAGEDPRPRQVPFDWDQRHTLNLSGALNEPNDYAITIILKYGSGSPYTPAVGSGFGATLERNSSDKPAWTTVDLRAEKYFVVGGLNLNAFLRVFNLFDSRYANGSVFQTTGSPSYSLTPTADAVALLNPSRFVAPRRIELGVGIRL